MAIHFCFLMLKEHPYGREMLRILLERGFQPDLILQEDSPVADEERAKFLTRIAGQAIPLTIAELTAGLNILHREVENHNSQASREILAAAGLPLMVLGGTRILHPPVLALASRGVVNAHPGLLPRLRGSSSVAWALYKDLPIGSTVHFVEPTIDTGPIILRRTLPVRPGDSYQALVRRVLTLSGELMAETLALFQAGEVESLPQDPAAGETLRVIPPELLAEALDRLAQGHYSHFAFAKRQPSVFKGESSVGQA